MTLSFAEKILDGISYQIFVLIFGLLVQNWVQVVFRGHIFQIQCEIPQHPIEKWCRKSILEALLLSFDNLV